MISGYKKHQWLAKNKQAHTWMLIIWHSSSLCRLHCSMRMILGDMQRECLIEQHSGVQMLIMWYQHFTLHAEWSKLHWISLVNSNAVLYKLTIAMTTLKVFLIINCDILWCIYTPCLKKKLCKFIFCQNFVKFRLIVEIFGTKIAKRTSFSDMYSFSTSPNLCQRTTV